MTNPRDAIREEISRRRPAPSSVHAETVSEHFNDLYGSLVFTPLELKKRIPESVFKKLTEHIQKGTEVDDDTADIVAQAMKEWAISKGCSHYTHWFQPLRQTSAQKHDSFINFFGRSGSLRFEFSGEELKRGEPDASSFPGGGLRSTHEARGYTSWDPSSHPFIAEDRNGRTLLIPTKYVSWTGDALDHKTPLLRSVVALSRQAVRMLRLLGDEKTSQVSSTLGCEQEFFVIDKAHFLARPDLIASGRTLLGAPPSRGQQLEDHYFGPIPERVMAYIQEAEHMLWQLGIPTKTRHNEVAPAQHEMAPIFEESNLACDHNLITMELMKKLAHKHNFETIFHEKPFKGVNGTGKHHNWSMATDTGSNLLNPSRNPRENTSFLVFLAAVIKAVDDHSDVLRISVASAGNDHRLGANEAPPAIISVYLGEELDALVQALVEEGKELADMESSASFEVEKKMSKVVARSCSYIELGEGMSPLHRDRTDRNRTSPFAFTGNKFEFRAPGGPAAVSVATMAINIAVADALRQMVSKITSIAQQEQQGGKSFQESKNVAIHRVIRTTLANHYRIVFNGNGYSQDWIEEAARRGLPNLKNTPDALALLNAEKNVKLFSEHKVLTSAELTSRSNIFLEQYCNQVLLEASATQNLVATHVLPSALKHQTTMAAAIASVRSLGTDIDVTEQTNALKEFTALTSNTIAANKKLEEILKNPVDFETPLKHAVFVRDTVKAAMDAVREYADQLEQNVEDSLWTLPKYSEMMHIK